MFNRDPVLENNQLFKTVANVVACDHALADAGKDACFVIIIDNYEFHIFKTKFILCT